ncbi:hypothetical protein [Streptomyces acidiscabies]|uniref:Uncharacterized protein n=1 Tax=Streptomyces acidiscabies TaxID=42234 RepID=A0A0L0JDQ3_9ACTN|nr:hypothetical protein [Streptomyces acidiscabies]KND23569.1 hypothetical protein IQ63_44020 [Streptomyces acidiscabies]
MVRLGAQLALLPDIVLKVMVGKRRELPLHTGHIAGLSQFLRDRACRRSVCGSTRFSWRQSSPNRVSKRFTGRER